MWAAAAEEPEPEPEDEPDTPKLPDEPEDEPDIPNKCCSWVCNPLYPPNYAKVHSAGSPLS